jgi:hypothetical protein
MPRHFAREAKARAFWSKLSSMVPISSQGGHSSQVKMRLLVNGGSISVVQLGADFLLVDAPFDHPPSDASIVLQVEQSERRWNVRLSTGISASSKRVTMAAAAAA